MSQQDGWRPGKPANRDNRLFHQQVTKTWGVINMNQILRRAMQDCDRYVIEMDYDDAKGNRTHRVVSPIRFMGSYRFLGLCLCREQPRQFQLSRCKNIRLVPASQVTMPMPITTTPATACGV